MLSNVVKALLLSSAVGFVASMEEANTGGLTERATQCNGCDAAAQGYGAQGFGGAQGFAGAQGSAGIQAGVGFGAMMQGYSSLTSSFSQLQSTIASSASIDAAIQATSQVAAQVQSMSSQYSSVSVSANVQARAQFEASAVQFFSSMQSFMMVGQQRYGAQWNSRFQSGISQQFAAGFTSYQSVAASMQYDLSVAIRRAHLDVGLFAAAGLNVSGLLRLNLGVGGLLHA